MVPDIEVAHDRGEQVSLMEPLLIGEGSRHRSSLTDLVLDLVQKSAGFRRSLPDSLLASLADLVRAMNCYYSNLIEGHDTHPVDIERALKNDYSQDAGKRDLQLEASAHHRPEVDRRWWPERPRGHKRWHPRSPSPLLRVIARESAVGGGPRNEGAGTGRPRRTAWERRQSRYSYRHQSRCGTALFEAVRRGLRPSRQDGRGAECRGGVSSPCVDSSVRRREWPRYSFNVPCDAVGDTRYRCSLVGGARDRKSVV